MEPGTALGMTQTTAVSFQLKMGEHVLGDKGAPVVAGVKRTVKLKFWPRKGQRSPSCLRIGEEGVKKVVVVMVEARRRVGAPDDRHTSQREPAIAKEEPERERTPPPLGVPWVGARGGEEEDNDDDEIFAPHAGDA